ncbi:hypothetical protein [Streptomyces sp. NPDC040750]|uniref:hypothetical protein n=1 Tax=Streptomyces sp. NPDC040750 TaxID=3154491 RepID=UPI0033C740AF
MGNPTHGAGHTGASHPRAVNEAMLALLRPKPVLSPIASEPADVLAVAQAAVDAPAGPGTIASYATEVALPATGTWSNPGKGSAQADIVLTALAAHRGHRYEAPSGARPGRSGLPALRPATEPDPP